ncbi:RNA-dependent RNA polymerase [Ustilaginoidea virens RNA virus 5]|uniref:RNA-dependent RNA polymerase n=1 Tax=Ustilaginoidea virens RNA virus 5 TaxID=1756615 RepID=UPI00071ABEF8|nr:RNA-dependent RNA polymerase [Ustilaginoidea virens RNA virus 5]ALP73431.1 RNA-dependent RNA polymerase [Ustilaginoidea virens RNA virus 5]
MAAHLSISERRAALGHLGDVFYGMLEKAEFPAEKFRELRATEQLLLLSVGGGVLNSSLALAVEFNRRVRSRVGLKGQPGLKTGVVVDPLLRVAASMLCARFAVQVEMTDSNVRRLVRLAFPEALPPLWSGVPAEVRGKVSLSALAARADLREVCFPYKTVPQATRKANVHLASLLTPKARELVGGLDRLIGWLAGRCSDDQVCSAIIYAHALGSRWGPGAAEIAARYILDPEGAVSVGLVLKAMGANSGPLGAALVEGKSLQGRGVGSLDLAKEAEQRCDPDWVAGKVLHCDPEELRLVIRQILSEELKGREIVFDTPEQFWERRWQWCVNGSHNRTWDARAGVDLPASMPGCDRFYRRAFSEVCKVETLTGWSGEVLAGVSPKLENGKTRAIFACDTLSYYAFEHLLGPVSAAWLDRRVVLDPGRVGHLGMAERINRTRDGGGIDVMLDYDDFNSHHSNTSMRILLEETCAAVGYDEELGRKLCQSFDNTWVKTPAGLSRVRGTLMSGHRGTTYINSVLNAAYIRLAVGRAAYEGMVSMHVGDDVYVNCPTPEGVEELVDRCAAIGCRMNPTKQSVGKVGAEFLRMGIRREGAHGYLARSVASLVSGNWVNEKVMDPEELLSSMVGTVRSLINRSGCETVPQLLAPAVSAVTRIKVARCVSLLSGQSALEGRPVFNPRDGLIRTWALRVERPASKVKAKDLPSNATDDYLAKAASVLELRGAAMSTVDPRAAMLDSSYRKTLAGDTDPSKIKLTLRSCTPVLARGATNARDLLRRPCPPGALERYPLLQLVKSGLRDSDVRELVREAGGDWTARDIGAEAWGIPSRSRAISGVASYTDAASLARRAETDVVFFPYPVHM